MKEEILDAIAALPQKDRELLKEEIKALKESIGPSLKSILEKLGNAPNLDTIKELKRIMRSSSEFSEQSKTDILNAINALPPKYSKNLERGHRCS